MATENQIKGTPDEVAVGPYRWRIEYDGQTCYDFDWSGVRMFRSKRIVLDPRQADTEIRQTALHEVLHAIGATFEIPALRDHTVDQTTHRPTDKIDAIATALLLLIRENPDFVQWLQEV